MAVVVISVGAPPELTRAVSSILRQDTRVELVVVNSGGGNVRGRLPEGANHIKILSFDELLGPGAARNHGVQATQAPFIGFLAADCVAEGDWVAARLGRHHAGADAVASAVVNSHPRHLVAWASHLALFYRRLPGTPAGLAARYGASYSRQLFVRHGLFDDIRIGEDTEFHQRLGKRGAPVWAPEVRTIHHNPTSLRAAWKDQYRRGIRSGKFWPQNHGSPAAPRVKRKFRAILEVLRRSLNGRERRVALASAPLLLVNLVIYEFGAQKGKRRPDRVAQADAKARKAAKSKRWQEALKGWTKSDGLAPGRMTPMLGRGESLLNLKRFEEAGAVYADARIRWPQVLAGHEGAAKAAEKTGHWELALEAWTEVDKLLPGQVTPRYRQAMALLELRRFSKADAIFAALRQDSPHHAAGYRGAAFVATERREWEQALAAYDELWKRFLSSDAVQKKINLLLFLNRISEAENLVKSLESADVEPLARTRVTLHFLQARHCWAAMIQLLEKQEPLVLKHPDLLNLYVTALSMLGRAGEALSLIERSRSGTGLSRKVLRVTALIRERRQDEAHDCLQEIWESKEVGGIPVILLSALMTAAVEKGGPELGIRILERIDDEAPRDHSGGILVLTALFQRARLECLHGLFASPARLVKPRTPLETKVREALSRRPSPTSESHGGSIREMCAAMIRWRENHPAFFPDPSFVLGDALEVALNIIDAVDSRRPLSVVRLGDGEGNFLPYREDLASFAASDRTTTRRTWWGQHELPGKDDPLLQELLGDAILSADIVGIPDLYRVLRVLGSRQMLTLTGSGRNTRGLVATLDFVSQLDGSRSEMLTSCHIHESLAYWGLWDLLLPRLGAVSLITCHPQLAGILASRHGIKIEHTHLPPSEGKFSAVFNHCRTDRHFPEFFEDLRGKLAVVRRGQVFLVAAGMLGKIYCHWIKDAGGIAIDVGSAADFWCGYDTRGLDEASSYLGPPGMKERLQGLVAADPRVARLLHAEAALAGG